MIVTLYNILKCFCLLAHLLTYLGVAHRSTVMKTLTDATTISLSVNRGHHVSMDKRKFLNVADHVRYKPLAYE